MTAMWLSDTQGWCALNLDYAEGLRVDESAEPGLFQIVGYGAAPGRGYYVLTDGMPLDEAKASLARILDAMQRQAEQGSDVGRAGGPR